jgi:hypothetical protein
MWGLPLNWWSDRQGEGYAFSTESIHRVLDQGGVVQAGGHPEETFLGPSDANRMEILFETMEARAGFAWTTPVEWARHADSLLDLDVREVHADEDVSEIVLSGRIAAGTTVFWRPSRLAPDLASATWNGGTKLPVDVIEGTALATLPAAPAGVHRIRFHRDRSAPSPSKPPLPPASRRERGLTASRIDASGIVFVQKADGSWHRRVRLRRPASAQNPAK